MTKQGREWRLMERELKSGNVLAHRFFKATDHFERRRKGKLEELKRHRLGFLIWTVREPRPSLIHKGGKP
jgi:hypothetical protein